MISLENFPLPSPFPTLRADEGRTKDEFDSPVRGESLVRWSPLSSWKVPFYLPQMNKGGAVLILASVFACLFACTKRSTERAKSSAGVPATPETIESERKVHSSPGVEETSGLAQKDAESRETEKPTKAERSPPPSPFRKVIDDRYGSLYEHDSELFYLSDRGVLSLATGEILARCDSMRGILMSGKSLYFAARLSPFSACPDEPYLLQRVGKKWPVRRFIDAHDLILEKWVAGSTIAAVVPYRLGPPWGYELVKIAGGVNPPHPLRGASHPTEPERKCYSELQEPRSLHAFPSGTLMVVGGSLCDLPRSEDEELSPEEEKARSRPAIENFPKGSYKSQIFRLPIDEVISSFEDNSEKLFILGKIKEGWQEDAPFELVLLSFDGKGVTRLSIDVTGVERLVRGPVTPPAEADGSSEGEAEAAALPSELWFSDGRSLRRPGGQGEPLWFPQDCEEPNAVFWGEHAWLSCEDGIYTTDPERTPLSIPPSDESSACEQFDPRPEYAVPGIYQKPSSPGGCSQRRSYHLFEGGKTKTPGGKPQPVDPWSERGVGPGIPQPKGTPGKLRLEL